MSTEHYTRTSDGVIVTVELPPIEGSNGQLYVVVSDDSGKPYHIRAAYLCSDAYVKVGPS